MIGLLAWLRGEPTLGDLYHRVGAQLGKSRKCPPCNGYGSKLGEAATRKCPTCGGGGWVSI